MILAEKIALLRRQNGWSQEELADQLNVSRQAVSKWEGGTSIPDLDKILKLSALFEVTTDYLLKDELEQPDAAVPVPQEEQSAEPSPEASEEPAEEAPLSLTVDGKAIEPAAMEENGRLMLPLVETGEALGWTAKSEALSEETQTRRSVA